MFFVSKLCVYFLKRIELEQVSLNLFKLGAFDGLFIFIQYAFDIFIQYEFDTFIQYEFDIYRYHELLIKYLSSTQNANIIIIK